MNRLDYSNLPPTEDPGSRPQYMEIDTGRKRRWLGLFAYVVFYLAVAGLLVFLFIRFTSSYMLAFGLVGGMVAYMALMGWWASKSWEQRE
jgi:hypothetical protein